MAEIDLIPSDYARDRGIEKRVRRFVQALLFILLAVGLGRAGIEFFIARNSADLARLRTQGQISAQAGAKAESVRKQTLETERRLSELDGLRGSERLRMFLQAMDNAYIESIWLDEIRFFRRDSQGTSRLEGVPGGARSAIIVVPKENPPAAGSTIKPPQIEQHVELAGHARDHSRLADFMRGLGQQPGIADVRLLDTGLRSYTSTVVVDLKLSLLIDGKSRGTK